jgi:hypothetical protein
MRDAPVLSHCSLLRNIWAKPTGVLEHRRERDANCWFSIFRGVSFWQHPEGDERCEDVMSGTNLWDRFPSCSNSCKLYRRIPGKVWSYCVYQVRITLRNGIRRCEAHMTWGLINDMELTTAWETNRSSVKFPAFYGTQRCIAVLTRARHFPSPKPY